MKAKTVIACVLTAAALPLAPALAQQGPQPTGPQGTGAYGALNAAVPVPQLVVPGDASVDQRVYERDMRRDDTRRPVRQRGNYDGPSWSTNPPAPPA